MPTLPEALDEIRDLINSPEFVRAGSPGMTIRPVLLKAGRRFQIVTQEGSRPVTRNVDVVEDLPAVNWAVETTQGTVRMQVTKKGAVLHRTRSQATPVSLEHDRPKEHLLDPGDPLFAVIGGNAAKRRQVDAFLRQLPSLTGRVDVVDLGCGNAYLTFAAYGYLTSLGVEVNLTGVDVREDQRERNTRIAAQLGWPIRFIAGDIATASVEPGPDMVLALHACDTATDDALARAIAWKAKWILAAPCCHKDVSRQLRMWPSRLLTAHGILRERFADVLTDVVRAAVLREQGYDVEVVEFIDSVHTPRNSLIKAVHTGRASHDPELETLLSDWEIKPAIVAAVSASSVSGSSA